jgi:hypothetical protein
VRLPSGQTVSFSLLELIAKSEHEKHNWSFKELAAALEDPSEHIRCAALLLLKMETKEFENHSAFQMSVEQLRRAGILAKWKAIAEYR